ncbi:hypothetical protein [Marilutibacter aestuarii]|uniref:Uncharacterized protein n=1 Tax=Marilutibacter aestuarii TaxID=1706195 RepID=A0A507ZUT4_9GAMM|nr:hypothetical protein [Lysobacter aestuarii]TQD39518.1 hypothetical protein FKV25_15240 [Lysobacter aestuarii]
MLNKTPRAHAALSDRSDALTAFERRVLIICDGNRTLDQVRGLLGIEATAAVRRLLAEEYLSGVAPPRGVLGQALTALRGERRPSQASVPSTPDPGGGRHPPGADAGLARRRSVVAAKMYVIGLLQLQRNPEAVAQAALLQTCRESEAIMDAIAESLDCIAATCNPSYTQRVVERLREITPEALLARLPHAPGAAMAADA